MTPSQPEVVRPATHVRVPLGLDRPHRVGERLTGTSPSTAEVQLACKSRTRTVAELDAESHGDLLDRIQGRLEGAINALLAEFESVATGLAGEAARPRAPLSAAVARLTSRPLIDELLGLGSGADLEELLPRDYAEDGLGGFLADPGVLQDSVFLRCCATTSTCSRTTWSLACSALPAGARQARRAGKVVPRLP